MKHGLICQLEVRNGETILVLHDATKNGSEFSNDALFTELPEPIETAIQNKELMAQLGENILIRLAVSNGIEI
jgi:hypothetical protein